MPQSPCTGHWREYERPEGSTVTDQPTPYGYNPPPPGFSGGQPATGKQLLKACWGLLRQDRELLWLPAIASLTGLIAALVLFVPGFAIGWAASGGNQNSWGAWVGGVFAAFAASVVSIYFQAALVIGAYERADGGDPTLRGVLAQAWTHKGKILSWAALTTTVGVAIRTLEQRLGAVGNILGFLGGIAWAVASFLVVPIVVVENLGPIDAVKRSAELIRQTWGTSLRTTLRFGLIQLLFFLPTIVVFVIGVILVASGSTIGIAVGIVLILAAVIAFLILAMVFSAISTYARALIYRYATGRPVPGISPQLFAGVFRTKGTRRGFA
jgi:hypothetical protein